MLIVDVGAHNHENRNRAWALPPVRDEDSTWPPRFQKKWCAISLSAVARSRGGGRQPIRLLVGHYPTISLAEARARGRPLLRDLQDGIDPRARKAEQLRAEAAERERRFDALAEQFIQRLAAARTARAIALRIRRELIARWGDRSIDKISQVDIAGMVTIGFSLTSNRTATY
jgi:hypothetical protein